MYQADIYVNAAKALIQHAGVSGALEAIAVACGEMAGEMTGKQPRSTSSEIAQTYRAVARIIERCAKSVRHRANRTGF